MPTAPDEVLAKLREETGTAQMAVFAEALYSNSEVLSVVAAAYMLGRCDGSSSDCAEPNGSVPAMAEAVLRSAGVLHERTSAF